MRNRILSLFFFSFILHTFSQSDSTQEMLEKHSKKIDSMKLKVDNILISGNEVTEDEIILREMSLRKGSTFTLKKYQQDLLNIYNLGLFTKVDMLPVPSTDKSILLNIDVQERWYILPLPNAGLEDGEWKKIWAAVNLRWDNFRGRNEQVNLYGRFFYNPAARFSYSVPWIGKKLHLFSGFNIGWSRVRNQSLKAVGKGEEGNTIKYNESNYDNINFNTKVTLGKYITKNFNVFTEIGYNYLRVTQYQPGRTISPDGKDKYMGFAFGVSYDTRNLREYSTRGLYLRSTFTRYGHIDAKLNFGRYTFESQTFLPFDFSKDYYITLASKVYTSLAVGAVIPIYHHVYLGYSEDYVRGWKGKAYEGEDVFTSYNELRIPIITPRYIKAKNLPVMDMVPVIKNLDLRYGLYFTIIYDVGTVFNKNDRISKLRLLNGAGIGLNFILPFSYVLRIDWVFRLSKPTVGQVTLNLSAKF